MGRNSEGELLLVTAGPVGGQGLASSAHCMGRQYISHSLRWQCRRQHSHRWTWSSTAAGALGRLVKLSCRGSEASSEPVPLPMSKDSSQHNTHSTQRCSAHRAEEGRAWGSQVAHQALCHPPLLAQDEQPPQQIHFSFPTGIPGAAPQSFLGSSTSRSIHTPAHNHPSHTQRGLDSGLPCPTAQHPPNTPTASNQSVSLLPSWHCSCHTPSLPPRA